MNGNSFQPNGFVTLVTDFGLQDDYVGLMHAAISRVNPSLRIINLCHEIVPGDIQAGSFLLQRDADYFPSGTVFIAVVDPGVGSERAMLAARIGDQMYVAPDNGLLGPLLKGREDVEVRLIENQEFFGPSSSSTFHGRDIFAPVGAHLASGTSFEEVGPIAEVWVEGESLTPRTRGKDLVGEVLWVDRFGNLVTNLDSHVMDDREIVISRRTLRYVSTFTEGKAAEPVWTIGSKGTVEVIVNNGSASKQLGIGFGHPVVARLTR